MNEGLLRRRADFVPASVATDTRAEAAIGILYHRNMIDARQLDGLERLTAVWHRWRRLAQCEGPHPSYDFGLGVCMDDAAETEAWRRTKAEMIAIRDAVRREVRSAQLALTMLDSLCIQNIIPPRLFDNWEIGRQTLIDAANSVASHFCIPVRA